MKNILCTCLALVTISLFSLTHVYGQQKKYELKENIFYADAEALFTLDEIGDKKDVILKNTKGERIILFQYKETTDKTPYYEIHFLTNNSKAEMKFADMATLGAFMDEAQLIIDGKLNIEAERKFVSTNGDAFSKEVIK